MRKITTCKGVELLVPQKGEKHPNAGRPKGAKNVMTRVLKDANRHGNLERMSAARWFVKCALSAALLLIACGLATAWFGNRLQVPATTTRDGHADHVERLCRRARSRHSAGRQFADLSTEGGLFRRASSAKSRSGRGIPSHGARSWNSTFPSWS